jgi:hypothetical protein
MCSGRGDRPLHLPGFPIRTSPDQSLVADSPGLIAGSYVLLRLLVPRHPPCALINLATTDARVHYAVLKIRAVPTPDRRVPRHSAPDPEMNSAVPLSGAVRRDVGPDRGGCRSARSLRTQQRARPACRPDWRSFPQAGVLTRPARYPDRITSAPHESYHLRLPPEVGSGQVETARCRLPASRSLERR